MAEPSLPEESIFAQALEIESAAERAAFLDKACGDNAALRAEVEALLRASQKSGDLLDVPENPGETTDEPTGERPGAIIGPYKLLEIIGEGGMGAVWMAEQTEPIQRRVALKVIKEGMDSKQVLARFEAERQALALMEHPNIARVLDAGKTPSGRPYFVMELVKGKPITTYCDEKRVPLRERLDLFGDVCRAVQHAHQKGIIHRDIKPSNVLVAPFDGKPVVKVIDFGVAKATGQRLTDKTLFTGFGALVGTPEYMSPEQAEVNNQDIDTRSDVYSLGVLLYELLTGSTPLTRKRIKEAALLEVLRVIREEEPPRPSTRLSESKDSLPSISAQRQTEPAKLTKMVRGELDWIVMRALEKDRGRRYETANGLAMDVQRYLADEPVQACPPSAWYRFGKFARRNKGRLTAAAVLGVAVLVAVGAVAASIGWAGREREARRARVTGQVEQTLMDVDRLVGEQKWPEAQQAVERAEAVLAGGEADDAIRRRAGDIRRDLAFVARLDAIRQESAIGVEGGFNHAGAARDYALAFRDYGADVEALPAEEAAARLRRNPALAAPVAAALDDWVEALRWQAKDEPGWKPLIAVARGLDPDPLRDRLRAAWGRENMPQARAELLGLGESIDVKAQSPAALCALGLSLSWAHEEDASVRLLQNGQYAYPTDFWLSFNLGYQLSGRKDYAGALRYYTAAMSLRPDSAAAHHNLGLALYYQGKLDEAVAEFRKAIALNPNLALPHNNLGNALKDQGKLDEAVAEYHKAIELDPKFALPHSNLGIALRAKGQPDEAIAEYREALRLKPDCLEAHTNLGGALVAKGQLKEAIDECREAIRLKKDLPVAHVNLAVALQAKGQPDEAIAELREAFGFKKDNPQAYHEIGASLLQRGMPDLGIAVLREAIRLKKDFPEVHKELGNALHDKGQLDDAIAEYREAIRLKADDPLAHINLGVTLGEKGQLDDAIAEYREAIRLKNDFPEAHMELGKALREKGQLDEAIAELREALRLKPEYPAAHNNLGIALGDKGREDEAIAEYREAIRLKNDDPYPHCCLGGALRRRGEFRQSLEELRRGHELGSHDPSWRQPSAQWVREAERLAELDEKLPGFLDGATAPASAGERIELAKLCSYKRLRRAELRFYEEAFAKEPGLADDLGTGNRYNAACAAALVAAGQGADAAEGDEKEKARQRGKALAWLQADLSSWAGRIAHGTSADRTDVEAKMRHWQADPDLAGVRGPESLVKLPETERQAWQKLWGDVADLLARTQMKTTPEKKSDAK